MKYVDEDHGRAEEIEDQPVDAEIGSAVGEISDGDSAAAERDRDEHERKRDAVQPAHAAEHQVREREPARDEQRQEEKVAEAIDGIPTAELGRRQILREMPGEDGEKAEDRERERDDSGDLAVAGRQRARLAVESEDAADDQHREGIDPRTNVPGRRLPEKPRQRSSAGRSLSNRIRRPVTG